MHEHVAAEAGVQRHLDEAGARDAEPEPEVLGPVAEHHRDPVALDEPKAGERVRNAVRRLVEGAVGQRLVLEADDLAVGLLLGPSREDRADRPLTVVHGAPLARPSRHRLELAERLGPALAGLEPPHRVRIDLLAQHLDRLRRRRLGDGHDRRGVELEAAACDGFVARHTLVDRGEPEPLAVPVEDGRRGDDRGDAPRGAGDEVDLLGEKALVVPGPVGDEPADQDAMSACASPPGRRRIVPSAPRTRLVLRRPRLSTWAGLTNWSETHPRWIASRISTWV